MYFNNTFYRNEFWIYFRPWNTSQNILHLLESRKSGRNTNADAADRVRLDLFTEVTKPLSHHWSNGLQKMVSVPWVWFWMWGCESKGSYEHEHMDGTLVGRYNVILSLLGIPLWMSFCPKLYALYWNIVRDEQVMFLRAYTFLRNWNILKNIENNDTDDKPTFTHCNPYHVPTKGASLNILLQIKKYEALF